MGWRGFLGFMTAAAFGVALSACATGGSLQISEPVARTFVIKTGYQKNGAQRSYRLHLPSSYRGGTRYPLVIALHGAFSTAKGMEVGTGWSAVADREGFIVAYPEGGWGIFGMLRHWNAGHCCGRAARVGEDDVGFLVHVIADVSSRVLVDPDRIYLTGFSNGGMLAYRAAAELTGMFAAVAPVAASHGGRASVEDSLWVIPEPKGPMPVLAIHGTEDESVPFNGGISARGGDREYLPATDAMRFWVQADGLDERPVVDRLNGGTITRSSWSRARDEAPEVVLYALSGWEHHWPGGTTTAKLSPDHPLHDFDAATVIWNFFSRRVRHFPDDGAVIMDTRK